jgi:hypothetical protein
LKAVRLTPYSESSNPHDPLLQQIKLVFNQPPPYDYLNNLGQIMLGTPWDSKTYLPQLKYVKLRMADVDRDHNMIILEIKNKSPALGAGWGPFFLDFVTKTQASETDARDLPGVPEGAFLIENVFGWTDAKKPTVGIANRPDVRSAAQPNYDKCDRLIDCDQNTRLNILLIAGAVFLASGLLVNFNWTSLHNFYRDRLAEAYFGKPQTGEGNDLRVSDLCNEEVGAPYHLTCCTLLLVGERKAPERSDNFLFSRKYFGSSVTHFWPTEPSLVRRFNNLAEVTALSGAAVTPAQIKSASLAVLLTILNLRLGQWLPHPERRPLLPWPCALGLLWDFWRPVESRRRYFVSDGGHDENLGLWPLVHRRCKLIIVSDASQDEEHAFEDFLKFCRRMRVLKGVQIFGLDGQKPIDLRKIELKPDLTSPYHYFVGRICYPAGFPHPEVKEAADGYIIYLKPSLTSDEENDLLRHFKYRRPFPHDPTLNQIYDEDTVESYRQLGSHIGDILGRELPEPAQMWDRQHRFGVIEELQAGLVRGIKDEQPQGGQERDEEQGAKGKGEKASGPPPRGGHAGGLAELVRSLLQKYQEDEKFLEYLKLAIHDYEADIAALLEGSPKTPPTSAEGSEVVPDQGLTERQSPVH